MHALDVLVGAVILVTGARAAFAQTATTADSPSTIVAGARAERADSALRAAEAQGFSAVVLVVEGGRIALRKGYGLAVRQRKQPFTPATVVQIGSNTKDFTAVAILQLQDRGKLRVSDSLGTYLPNVPADKRGITIWELVTHRSGLPLYSGRDFEPITRDEFIARVMSMSLVFAPGSEQRYSNVGYGVLAAIIELVTGDSYGGYVNKNIWIPLGMKETGLLLAEFDTLRLAHGYQGDEDNGTMLDKPHAKDGPYWNLRGGGGFLSTVSDMYHFYDVLFNSATLLRPATRDLRFPPNTPTAIAGSDMISFFLYERAPAAGIVLMMATNSSDFPAPKARDGVAAAFGLPLMRGDGRRMQVGGPRTPVAGPEVVVVPKALKLPDTPAGRKAFAYISVFNARDTAVVRRFIQDSVVQRPGDHRTIEQRLSDYRGMRAQVGTMTPVELVSSATNEIVLKMITEHGEQVTLTVGVEDAAPNRIVEIRIEAE